MKHTILLLLFFLVLGCNAPNDGMKLGHVERLPKGEYTIRNWGSRHIVRCERPDGKYYTLNDSDFAQNGIDGYDAHQYSDPTHITIK